MAEFPSKVSTRTSSPAQGVGASMSALRPDLDFLRSSLGVLMVLQLVSELVRGPHKVGGGVGGGPGEIGLHPRTPPNPGTRTLYAECIPSPHHSGS